MRFDEKKIIPKCDHVVKEYVPVTFKWAKAVSPLFSIQWIAGVTKVQSPDRQIFLLSNFSTIPQPIIMARVTVAPFVGVKANTEKTTFAFSGACAEKKIVKLQQLHDRTMKRRIFCQSRINRQNLTQFV